MIRTRFSDRLKFEERGNCFFAILPWCQKICLCIASILQEPGEWEVVQLQWWEGRRAKWWFVHCHECRVSSFLSTSPLVKAWSTQWGFTLSLDWGHPHCHLRWSWDQWSSTNQPNHCSNKWFVLFGLAVNQFEHICFTTVSRQNLDRQNQERQNVNTVT